MAKALPLFHDLCRVLGKDSPATSRDGLPRQLVGALPRYALQTLAQVLQALFEGALHRLLTTVLHSYLA